MEELESVGRPVIPSGGEPAHDGTPGLDVREEAGAEHGLDNGCSIAGLASLGGSDGEEAKGVGVEVAELALIAEARDDGLGASEAGMRVLVGELREQAAEASGIGQMGGLGVGNPSLLCFSLAEERQKLLVFIR